MKYRLLLITMLCVFLLMTGFYGWRLYHTAAEYREGEKQYEELTQFAALPYRQADPPFPSEEPANTESGDEASALPQVDFDVLRKINPDIVGWLHIPDTSINYPVVQGEDNRFYLDHLLDGVRNSSGCIFLDCANTPDFSDRHSILHGHNMKNGTMFSGLLAYQDRRYFEEHSVVYLILPDKTLEANICAAVLIDSTQTEAWRMHFATDEEFSSWLKKMETYAIVKSGRNPALDDRIITLSTCTNDADNGRFLLYTILGGNE